MKTTLVIDTAKAFTASVATIPQFELGEQHTLRIEAANLDAGCKLGLAAYTLAGDPLFAVHDMAWTTGVAEATFGTSTGHAVAALGERQRMEIIVGVDEYTGTAPNQTRKTIAQFKTVLYRDSYAGTENPETIAQAIMAVETATAQAVIATTQAGLATTAKTAAEAAQTAAELAASQTEADTIATAADRVQTGLDRQAAEGAAVQTGLDVQATAGDRVQTGLDRAGTTADALATAADRAQTGIDRDAAADWANEATNAAGTATTKAAEAAASASQASTILGASVRHDTSQALSAAAKAQACTNVGLAAPVPMPYPEISGTGAYTTVTLSSSKFFCQTGGATQGVQYSFRDRHSGLGQVYWPTYAEIFAQLNGAADNDTFLISLMRENSPVVMDVTVTRVSSTSYTIGSVTVSGAPAPIRLAFTNEGTANKYITKLYVNGTLAATSNASSYRTNRILISTSSLNSYGWTTYLPHVNYWAVGI